MSPAALRKTIQMHAKTSMPALDRDMESAPGGQLPSDLEGADTPSMRGFLKRFYARWEYLTAQEAFHQAPVATMSRLISWRARCALRRAAIVRLPSWEVHMFLPPEWRGIGKLIFAFREHYEPELTYLSRMLSSGQTFIDVGANLGIYTLVAGKIVGESGRVIAFEPSIQSFPVLQRNIALNGLNNVVAFPVALSQNTGSANLYHGPNPSLNSLGKDASWKDEAEEIVVELLDNLLQRASIDRVDVIKMDVQGAEELVLHGAKEVLTSMRPIIILEIWPEGPPLLGLSPYGAWELLGSLGYEFFEVGEEGSFSRVKSPPENRNVVAIHRQKKMFLNDSRKEFVGADVVSDVPLPRMQNMLPRLQGKWRYFRTHAAFRQSPLTTLFRLFRWRLHCALGIPAIVNLDSLGVRFYLPPKWRGAGSTMIFAVRDRYERELAYLKHFLSPGMVVIDAGANCGIYSVAAAKLITASGLVLSFEPGLQSFDVLRRNIDLNHFSNVRAYRAALSDRDGTARLYHDAQGPNSFSLGSSGGAGDDFELVPIHALDRILEHEAKGRVGLIKIDVEGAEELVVRGAEQIIARSHPKIIFEVNASAAKHLGLSPNGAWEMLERWDYKFFSLGESGKLSELYHPPAAGHVRNVIAMHRGEFK
jgi:FkbM family methyltransferase